MSGTLRIVERSDGTGSIRHIQCSFGNSESANTRYSETATYPRPASPRPWYTQIAEFASKVFLPSGYPHSVSPDYLRYQIFNALQAFCSSLAGLLSSRALLEGLGVGNSNASATQALLLTIFQDFFGRITTVCAAYALGSSLAAEAKTFRLLADITNDAAIVLDTLSPLLLPRLQVPGARVAALCLSGSLRAMCGICAGGSKAALAMHFATPVVGRGDIGDLNAKDSSRETVLALFGMLAGSLIVPHLTTPQSTYEVLFTLVGLHLLLNYLGMSGVVLRTLNRQRLAIAWHHFRQGFDREVPSPAQVARRERLLELDFSALGAGLEAGHCACKIGSSLASVLHAEKGGLPPALLHLMQDEAYVLWLDAVSLETITSRTPTDPSTPTMPKFHSHLGRAGLQMHICLRTGYTATDLIKAWIHATEIGRMIAIHRRRTPPEPLPGPTEFVLAGYRRVNEQFSVFLAKLKEKGWDTRETGLLIGTPQGVIVELAFEQDADESEGRKER
ncbi:vitamin B6 photo-protection and homoeostasis-domain-containing protein [Mycena amicta]|nr:vitamin B6 photo-protection and homoeostasis-domain-containing protein [Mycena amicta]